MFDGLPQAVTLCGWLLPGPVRYTLPAPAAPRPAAICAAVLPLPYRLEVSALPVSDAFAGLTRAQVALDPLPPTGPHFVQWSVELLGLTPAAVEDDAFAPCVAVDGADAFFTWPGAELLFVAGCAAGCAAGAAACSCFAWPGAEPELPGAASAGAGVAAAG